jgi:hypothetical protein
MLYFCQRSPKGDSTPSIQEVDLELMLPKVMFIRYKTCLTIVLITCAVPI